jgi:hypothetical protein
MYTPKNTGTVGGKIKVSTIDGTVIACDSAVVDPILRLPTKLNTRSS